MRERLSSLELPERTNLENAIELNQKIWRNRSHFTSISSPIEIPEKFTRDVFAKVQDKYARYIDPIHLKKPPIVGFSVLPEYPISLNTGYYYPNIGKYKPLKLFEEFGTDWLAKVIIKSDPLKNNGYLSELQKYLKESKLRSISDLFLRTLYDQIQNRKFSKKFITNFFAKILIQGDTDFMNAVKIITPNGKKLTFNEMIAENKKKAESWDKTVLEQPNLLQRAMAHSFLFIGVSYLQLIKMGYVGGQLTNPGLINLFNFPQKPGILMHEYIHALSFHENTSGGIPIKGYTLFGKFNKL